MEEEGERSTRPRFIHTFVPSASSSSLSSSSAVVHTPVTSMHVAALQRAANVLLPPSQEAVEESSEAEAVLVIDEDVDEEARGQGSPTAGVPRRPAPARTAAPRPAPAGAGPAPCTAQPSHAAEPGPSTSTRSSSSSSMAGKMPETASLLQKAVPYPMPLPPLPPHILPPIVNRVNMDLLRQEVTSKVLAHGGYISDVPTVMKVVYDGRAEVKFTDPLTIRSFVMDGGMTSLLVQEAMAAGPYIAIKERVLTKYLESVGRCTEAFEKVTIFS